MPAFPPRTREIKLGFGQSSKTARVFCSRAYMHLSPTVRLLEQHYATYEVHYTLGRALYEHPAGRVLGEQASDLLAPMLLLLGNDVYGTYDIYPRESLAGRKTYALFELLRACTDKADITPFMHVMDWLHERSYVLPDRVWKDASRISHLISDEMHARLSQHAYFGAHPAQLTLLQTQPKKALDISPYFSLSMDKRIQNTCDALGIKPMAHSHYLNKMDALLWANRPDAVFGKDGIPLAYLLSQDKAPMFASSDGGGLQSRNAFLRLVEIVAQHAKSPAQTPYFDIFYDFLSYLHKHKHSFKDAAWDKASRFGMQFTPYMVDKIAAHPYWLERGNLRQLKVFLPQIQPGQMPAYIRAIQDLAVGYTSTTAIDFRDELHDDQVRMTQVYFDMMTPEKKGQKASDYINPAPVHQRLTALLMQLTPNDVFKSGYPNLTHLLVQSEGMFAFQKLFEKSVHAQDMTPFLQLLDYLHQQKVSLPSAAWAALKRYEPQLNADMATALQANVYLQTQPDKLALFLRKGKGMGIVSIGEGASLKRFLKIQKATQQDIRHTQILVQKLDAAYPPSTNFVVNMAILLDQTPFLARHLFGSGRMPLDYLVKDDITTDKSEHTRMRISYTAPMSHTYPFFKLVKDCATAQFDKEAQLEKARKIVDILNYLQAQGTVLPNQTWHDVKRLEPNFHTETRMALKSSYYWQDNPEQAEIFLPNTTKDNDMAKWEPDYAPEPVFNTLTGKERIAHLVSLCLESHDFVPLDSVIGQIDRKGDDITAELPQVVGVAIDSMHTSFKEMRDLTNMIKPSSYPLPLVQPKPKGLRQKTMALFGWKPDKEAYKPEAVSPTVQYTRTMDALNQNIDQFTDAINVLRRHEVRGRGQADAFDLLSQDIQDYLDDADNAALLAGDSMLAQQLIDHSESLRSNAQIMRLSAQKAELTGERVSNLRKELKISKKVATTSMTIKTDERLPDAEALARSLHGAQVKLLTAADEIMRDLILVADLSQDNDPARTKARIAESEGLRVELKKLKGRPALATDVPRNNGV